MPFSRMKPVVTFNRVAGQYHSTNDTGSMVFNRMTVRRMPFSKVAFGIMAMS